jgi:transcriptional regulator with PAS, ATPase and Fis domain
MLNPIICRNGNNTMEHDLIGVSPNIRKTKKTINQVADTKLDILVCGETGVGKELVVHNLYQKSKRVGKPFVKVNCAALPDTLLESEMFGYERGAFTGAERRKRGKFEQADGGVLFLDEIGDMSLALQSKLLHALQDRDFTPLGSERCVKTDVWVIAATNHKLEVDIKNGQFRADLYHRINTINIHIEPIRNRPEDIPFLISYYIQQYASQLNGKKPPKLSEGSFEKLIAYHWPGNVRQLQNVLKRILIFGDSEQNLDEMLQPSFFPQLDTGKNTTNNKILPSLNASGFIGDNQNDLANFSLKKIRKTACNSIEKSVISYVLNKTGWNRTKASKMLNISYRTLLTKIQNLNIKHDFNDLFS